MLTTRQLYSAGRWFNIHAFANAVVVIFCLPSMYQWITDPLSVVSSVGQEAPDPVSYFCFVLFHEILNRLCAAFSCFALFCFVFFGERSYASAVCNDALYLFIYLFV